MTMAQEYKAVDELNIPKYMGRWHQVYGDNFNKVFQGDGRCSTADYILQDDNTVYVLNKQIDPDNSIDKISGTAFYKDDDCCGYLTVKLDDKHDAPYWVLKLGPIVNDLYDYSIVSDDKAISLFVLARNVDRFYKDYNDIVLESLKELDFTKKYNMPVKMNQTECFI
jgi:lipocalin